MPEGRHIERQTDTHARVFTLYCLIEILIVLRFRKFNLCEQKGVSYRVADPQFDFQTHKISIRQEE